MTVLQIDKMTKDYCERQIQAKGCIECEDIAATRSLMCDIEQTEEIEAAKFRYCDYKSLPEDLKKRHNINGDTTTVPLKIACTGQKVCELNSRRYKDRVLDEMIAWPWTAGNPSHNEKHTTFDNVTEEECLCKCKQRTYDPDAQGYAQNPCFGIQYEHATKQCKLISATTEYEEWQVFVKGPNNSYDGYRPGHLFQPSTIINGEEMVPFGSPRGCGTLEQCIQKCNDNDECLYVFDGPHAAEMGGMMIKPGFDTIVLQRGESLPKISPYTYSHNGNKTRHQKRMIEKCIASDGSIDAECFNENK